MASKIGLNSAGWGAPRTESACTLSAESVLSTRFLDRGQPTCLVRRSGDRTQATHDEGDGVLALQPPRNPRRGRYDAQVRVCACFSIWSAKRVLPMPAAAHRGRHPRHWPRRRQGPQRPAALRFLRPTKMRSAKASRLSPTLLRHHTLPRVRQPLDLNFAAILALRERANRLIDTAPKQASRRLRARSCRREARLTEGPVTVYSA